LTNPDKCRRSRGAPEWAPSFAEDAIAERRVDLTSGEGNDGKAGTGFDLVHADLFRFFPELVRELGGDPDDMLRRLGVDAPLLANGGSSVGYRAWVTLLEHAAAELQCADFGLRLARRQGGGNVFGSMREVMLSARTFGEGLSFMVDHSHAHSLAVRARLVRDPDSRTLFSAYEILLDRLPSKCQAIEQVMLLGHLNAVESTGGRARVREVRFRHRQLSPLKTYRRYFGCEARFDQQEDGVVFFYRDLACPLVDADARAYAAATSRIDSTFPRVRPPMHVQVRGVILQFLGTEDCNPEEVAAQLGLHLRTLHRRLKAEGKTFLEVRDEVRRDVALYYVQQTDVALSYVAQKLGYAEPSVFSRSFVRWFGVSPRRLRTRARADRGKLAAA
jgi:AraC-like DNA-binding protein